MSPYLPMVVHGTWRMPQRQRSGGNGLGVTHVRSYQPHTARAPRQTTQGKEQVSSVVVRAG